MPAKDHIPDWFHKELDAQEKTAGPSINAGIASIEIGLMERLSEVRRRNCFYCMHFDHPNDVCLIAKPPAKPPTFILVHGCRSHFPEDEIPF